jgi:malate synthase
MAAQIPVKHDSEANEEALDKVRVDKEREAKDGHDGTWVAHPGLVAVAREVFDSHMPGPNQIGKKREDVLVTEADLLQVPEGLITERGLRTNIRVALLYLESWLSGVGAVAIDHLMEDAATAEISRAQVWQWMRHEKGRLDDGRDVTPALVKQMIAEEKEKLKAEVGDGRWRTGRFAEAEQLFSELVFNDELIEFLTIPGERFLSNSIRKGEE